MSLMRTYRRALGLSQSAFAAQLNVPLETYRPWDSGRREPPPQLLTRARTLAGYPDDTLLLPLPVLALMIGVHVRTLHTAARSGRLVVAYDTRTTFRRLRPRATLKHALDFRRHYYGTQRRPPATPVPLTWASVPEDYDVQLKALRRRLDISQSGFARLVGAVPAMCTRRVFSSITKKTKYRRRPASVNTSTVNRSAAARPSQCVCRNVFQGMRRLRSGAGSIPWSVQDPLHRGPSDLVAEVRERPADPCVPPLGILDRHPDHERGHVTSRHRPASTAAGAAVVRLGDQSPVPAENRVRRDDAGDLHQGAVRVSGRARRVDGVGHRSGEATEGPGAPGGPDSPPGDTRSDRLGGGSPSQRT